MLKRLAFGSLRRALRIDEGRDVSDNHEEFCFAWELDLRQGRDADLVTAFVIEASKYSSQIEELLEKRRLSFKVRIINL